MFYIKYLLIEQYWNPPCLMWMIYIQKTGWKYSHIQTHEFMGRYSNGKKNVLRAYLYNICYECFWQKVKYILSENMGLFCIEKQKAKQL